MKKVSVTIQIMIALALSIVVGYFMQDYASVTETYIMPFGTIFLNLLKFIVVPLVMFSIIAGVLSMEDVKKVGKLGIKAMIYFTCTTVVAIATSATIASIGTPGIPGGSLALMAMVFASAGIPLECVAIAAGIDRIVDMGRTTMSITGDASCAVVMQNLTTDVEKTNS